jgi:hypothetical protein
LTVDPDAGTRAELDSAGRAIRAAIGAMGSVGGADHADRIDEWLRLHTHYEYAVEQLLASVAQSPQTAEPFEEVYVDATVAVRA